MLIFLSAAFRVISQLFSSAQVAALGAEGRFEDTTRTIIEHAVAARGGCGFAVAYKDAFAVVLY